MKIFKKICFVVIYYLLASLIDQIFMMFFGNADVSFILTALCICIISLYLRNADIIKRNYLQEQRDEYSKSFKTKFNHIVKSFEFKVEIVLGTIVCLLFTAIPRFAAGACYALANIAINRLYGVALIPLFFVVNFVIWYAAYHKSFKKKKY